MTTQIQTQIRSLTTLLENLRSGIIQVPPFQRDFVWDRTKVKHLFDSIYKSYPIGSILLWRPREKPVWDKNRDVGGFTIPGSGEPKSYVLDGCQRLSSLFGCLTNPATSGLKCNEKIRRDFFDLYFDLKDDSFIYPAGNPKPYQVPVNILTSTSEFRQYTRKILEPNITDSIELDSYLDKADAFSRILVEYKLAVIEVDGATLNDAVNIFSRINSKGTEISYDWMVNALSFSKDFNFSYEVDSVLQKLEKYNFSGISRNIIFRCYQSAFDDNLYIDTDIENLADREDFVETSKRMSPAIIKAVDFLFNRLNVIDNRLLPYTAQLAFLSVFFMRVGNPTESQLNDLEHWFWTTTYSNYFTIVSLSGQRNAFTHFLRYIDGKAQSPLYPDNFDKKLDTMPWPNHFNLSAVRCKALALFQLKYQSDKVNERNSGRKLTVIKLLPGRGSIPENIIVAFSDFDSDNLCFIPSGGGSHDKVLEERRELLQQAEKQFVEELDINYKV